MQFDREWQSSATLDKMIRKIPSEWWEVAKPCEDLRNKHFQNKVSQEKKVSMFNKQKTNGVEIFWTQSM